MTTRAKVVTAALLAAQVISANFGVDAAQAGQFERSALPEDFCDYCKDYTDAATGAGVVHTAYRPGVGYAIDTAHASVVPTPRQQEQTGVPMIRRARAADK